MIKSLRVTEEMKREVAYYRLACEAHADSDTEAHAKFWEREMDRCRANLMDIMSLRLGKIVLPASPSGCDVFFVRPGEEDDG